MGKIPSALELMQEREPRPETPVTTKQANYIARRIDNPQASDVQIARESGYSISAKSRASNIKKQTQPKIDDLLNKAGLSVKRAIRTYKEAIAADKTFVTKDGDVIERPDHSIRLKAAKDILLLHNMFPAAKVKVEKEESHTFRLMLEEVKDMPVDAAKEELKKLESGEITADFEVTDGS